jgi:hypothetical protein
MSTDKNPSGGLVDYAGTAKSEHREPRQIARTEPFVYTVHSRTKAGPWTGEGS